MNISILQDIKGLNTFLHKTFFSHFLENFRWLCWRNYHSDTEKIKNLLSREVEKRNWSNSDKLSFKIGLAESGNPALIFNNFRAEVHVWLATVKPTEGIRNFEWAWKIVNEAEIPLDLLEEVKKLTIAAVNFQQRLVACSTIARWQNETLDKVAEEMYYFQFPDEEAQQTFEKVV